MRRVSPSVLESAQISALWPSSTRTEHSGQTVECIGERSSWRTYNIVRIVKYIGER